HGLRRQREVEAEFRLGMYASAQRHGRRQAAPGFIQQMRKVGQCRLLTGSRQTLALMGRNIPVPANAWLEPASPPPRPRHILRKTLSETAMQFKDIVYATDGAVATITLNRPRYKNAQSYRMLDEIDGAFAQAKADNSVRVLVIRGSGGNFSSGHDLGTEDAVTYRKA